MSTGTPITTVNISLPQPLKQYVDRKVASGMYGSVSEFIREAIREKQQHEKEREQATAHLTRKLLEGLDSGEPATFTKDYFKSRKRTLAQRAMKRRSA
ncbi:MAG TPA: type II toxin-antitoxin system ParD family antitoxin [Tepidisphaeraceae bacterium]|nr:type II toxin-antitoxin system ParD family antitoxin [Tepidisphaeraceae bacterium]